MDLPDNTMTDTNRAQNVCHACMLRKKACDKTLPACGFCASRRLLCRYDILAPKSEGRRIHNPGRHFVRLQSQSVSPQAKTVTRQPPSRASQQDHTPIHQSNLYVLPRSVEESLNQLVQHFTKLTKLTCDNIIDLYFQDFHKWLPVVSPDSFRREASRYREEGRLPPADFTVLLLAMLLIILPGLDPSLRPPRASQEFLYTTTKLALSQAQASICTSLRLVQAALLIALREYTCIRPDAAYISMMTCAGLARVVGIGITGVRTTRDVQNISDYRSEGMERVQNISDYRSEGMERDNLIWAIAMLERLILCEIDQKDLQPQTEYSSHDCQLPSDLKPTVGLDSKPGPILQALNQVTSSSLDAADTDQFGRQAQSVSLLDRLLFVMRLTASNKETKLAELAELDREIRRFLEVAMGELEWTQTPICVFVALCVRLLFLLHGSVLDTLQYPKSETDHQKRDISGIGLDMVCRMTLDVVLWLREGKSPIVPICCFYNLRAARKHMQERNKLVIDEALSRDVDNLLHAEETYCKTWVF
ncbi:hypothetical protein MMC18_002784 [Xylographa bjoerkii]|nr:hypothetical protein [Xylographa bjoerkii]